MSHEIINIVDLNECPDCLSDNLYDLYDTETKTKLQGILCEDCAWIYIIGKGVVTTDIIKEEM